MLDFSIPSLLTPLVGSEPPAPSFLPKDWESTTWPKLRDLQAFLDWIRLQIRAYDNMSQPSAGRFLIEGYDIPVVRDAYRLVTLWQDIPGLQLPEEPNERYQLPSGAARAAAALRVVEDWMQQQSGLPDTQAPPPAVFAGEGQSKTGRRKRTRTTATTEELNLEARKVLRNPKMRSLRKLADAIGCSEGKACELPAWRAYQNELNQNGPKQKHAVSLTKLVLGE